MNDAVKLAKSVKPVEKYADPASKHISDWNWRPLEDVQNELGLTEIPSHVHEFGKFMDRTAERAGREGLTPRDLLKAYTITRASIQRRATPAENLHKSGLALPPDVTGMVRPEGAFGHWLHTPAGQSYLDAAQRGQVHEPAVQDAMQRMMPFGKHNDLADALRWGATNLPANAAAVSHLVAAGRERASSPQEWRNFIGNIRGIGPSKAGFVASLMGRGDQPTLDARQIILHTGRPSKEASSHIARKGGQGGEEAVDRLAARQKAMNLTTLAGMEPYYQHLAHHAVWDKAGNEMTTHQDVMDAMQHAATGGTILNHPVAQIMNALHQKSHAEGGNVEGYRDGGSPEDDIIRQRLAAIPSIDHPNPAMREKALAIAQGTHRLNPLYETGEKNKRIGHSFYTYKGGQEDPSNVQSTVLPIPGATLLTPKKMSYEDFYKQGKGGTFINLGGDRSRLGRITHIDGEQLAWPVDLHAGPQYMLEPNKGAVWANAAGQTTRNKNIIEPLLKKGPVYGMYAPMGPLTVDSSFQMTDALMSQIGARKLDKKAAKAFDESIKSASFVGGKKPEDIENRKKIAELMKGWPGISNAWEAKEYLKNIPGTIRSLIVKDLDRSDWQQMGFPHVGKTRVAITDPELLNVGGNMIGHRVVQLSHDSVMPTAFKHNTYPEETAGTYVGDVPLVQRHYALPEAINQFAAEPHKPGVLHPYSENPNAQGGFKKMTEDQKVIQNIDEPWLESVNQGLANQSKYGFAEGGDVEPTWHDKLRNHIEEHPARQIHGVHVIGEPTFLGSL